MANGMDGVVVGSGGGSGGGVGFVRPVVDPLRLTIFFPCWNEGAHVESMTLSALEAGAGVVGDVERDLEVLIVDDGSTDETASIAERLASSYASVRHVRNEVNGGYGAALRRGFLSAAMPWVFYTDGDGQFDLSELGRVIDVLRSDDSVHIVSGYRDPRRDPLGRVLAGKLWTHVANALFGTRVVDVDGAFKVFPRALFDHIVMRSTGGLIDAEVLGRASSLGCVISQVGVTHLPRRSGRATGLAPRTVARGLRELVSLAGDIRAGPMGRSE